MEPPWEVLVLVGQHLDPKTLATTCCVSKSWFISMSDDQIWNPLCTHHFPSLSDQLKSTNPSLSYRRLYQLAATAAAKRRLKKPPPKKPPLSLDNLLFLISIRSSTGVINVAKRGSRLLQHDGLFRFDVDVECTEIAVKQDLAVSWNVVVMDGWSSVFTMVECEGKVGSGHGWFSAELPVPGCCWSSESVSGVVGDLSLCFSDCGDGDNRDEVVVVNKVSVGILSIVNWRYLTLENGLSYLHHFLLPTQCY